MDGIDNRPLISNFPKPIGRNLLLRATPPSSGHNHHGFLLLL